MLALVMSVESLSIFLVLRRRASMVMVNMGGTPVILRGQIELSRTRLGNIVVLDRRSESMVLVDMDVTLVRIADRQSALLHLLSRIMICFLADCRLTA